MSASRKALIAVLGWWLLTAGMCATPGPVTTACLPLAPISKADQAAIAAQLATMPDDDAMVRAINDWIRMRDADRACKAAKP